MVDIYYLQRNAATRVKSIINKFNLPSFVCQRPDVTNIIMCLHVGVDGKPTANTRTRELNDAHTQPMPMADSAHGIGINPNNTRAAGHAWQNILRITNIEPAGPNDPKNGEERHCKQSSP